MVLKFLALMVGDSSYNCCVSLYTTISFLCMCSCEGLREVEHDNGKKKPSPPYGVLGVGLLGCMILDLHDK